MINYNSLPLLIFTLLYTASCKYTPPERNGTIKTYHENGNIKSEIVYKNDQMNGMFKVWFDNGQLHDSAYFLNDSLVGYSVSFYKNGIRNYDHNRNDDHKLHGLSRFWYENGVLGDSGYYRNGKLDGEWRKYFTNGRLQNIKNYSDSKPNGRCVYFNENGDTLKVELFKFGELLESRTY